MLEPWPRSLRLKMNFYSLACASFHQLFYRAAKLVGARCGLAVAANALEACNHVLILHTCYQLAYSLQVTVATAVELHFFQYSVLARYLNVSRTCSVCGVCYCFHGFGLIFYLPPQCVINLPPLRSSLLGFKRDSILLFTPPLWGRGGGPLAVEEMVYNSRFLNLPPQHCCSSLLGFKRDSFYT